VEGDKQEGGSGRVETFFILTGLPTGSETEALSDYLSSMTPWSGKSGLAVGREGSNNNVIQRPSLFVLRSLIEYALEVVEVHIYLTSGRMTFSVPF
jgi:hypothetical protein